jgi:hypothetical protein
MVANEVVSGGVAERNKVRSSLEVGEHDGDQPISALRPGAAIAQEKPTKSVASALARQRVAGPIAVLDDEDERLVASLQIRKLTSVVRPSSKTHRCAPRASSRRPRRCRSQLLRQPRPCETVRPWRQEIEGLGRLGRTSP